MKIMRQAVLIWDRINWVGAVAAAVLLMFAMLSVSAEVVMRYFLNRPLIWVVEVTEVILLYIAFLGVAWVLKREGHVKVEIVINRLKLRTQALVGVVTSSFGVVIYSLLVWYGARVTWNDFQIGVYEPSILEIPNAIVLAIIPIGAFLLMVQFLARTFGFLQQWKSSQRQVQDGAGDSTLKA